MCMCVHKALHSNSLNCNGYLIFPVYLEIRKGDGVGSSLTSLGFKFLIKKKSCSSSDKIKSAYEFKLFVGSCAMVNIISEKQVHFRVLNSFRISVNFISIEGQLYGRILAFVFSHAPEVRKQGWPADF